MLATDRRGGAAAYSLTELIVVIAVVGLLLAILIPVIASFRTNSETARCAANLRQIGNASHLYISEHEGRLFPDKFFYYPQVLGNYLDLPQKTQQDTVFTCPALKRLVNGEFATSSWHNRTYSINNYILPTTGTTGRHIDEIQEPARMILLADGVAVYPGFSNTITPAQARDTTSTLYPHQSLNHALFVDGHVDGVDYKTMSQHGSMPIWGKPE